MSKSRGDPSMPAEGHLDGAVSGAGYALIWDVEPQWDGQRTSSRHA